MIDINLIRNSLDKVLIGVELKNYPAVGVHEVIGLDQKRVGLLQRIEELRQERNWLAKDGIDSNRERGREIKDSLKELEPQFEEVDKKYQTAISKIPNLPLEGVPPGNSEEGNQELRVVGEKPDFRFETKDHVVLGKELDIIDFEAGSKVSGSGFYYLKGDGALLEVALVSYALKFLTDRGFTAMITPDLAMRRFYEGTGYLPKGEEAQTYTVGENLGLIATSEVTIAGYHADETLTGLPKKYGGYSHCFRMEDGAYGKYSKGLYRVHQFTKVEMFAFTKAEDSENMHQEFLKTEEDFWQSLGIPYRVLEMCTGDLGAQAARKYDLEAWMPGRGDWGEVTSTSNTTDYQARNLGIRYRDGDETKFAHMLNGTLVATSRAIISILENNQQEDGSVTIPEVLRPFMGKDKISK